MGESVFAFPAGDFWKLLTYKKKGLIKGNNEVLRRIVQNGLFLRRSELEEDPSFKQIIPYAIISNKEPERGGARRSQSFYLFRRRPGQTEKRLHNKFSLGVGGHMNPAGSMKSEEQYLIDELKRELFEEVRLTNGCFIEDIEFIGFINDDTIPVGTFHIGLLYNVRVSNKDVYVNETDKMSAEWIDRYDLAEFYEGMETWSKITYDFYIQLQKPDRNLYEKR
jgi:predicted NUDIX family phosphoesterase